MPSHTKPSFGIAQNVKLYATLAIIIFRSLIRFIIKLPSRIYAGWPIRRCFTVCYLQESHRLSLEQSYYLSPPTGESIESFCRTKGIPYTSTLIECGGNVPNARLFTLRVGDDTTKRALVYFHGGGYAYPISQNGQVAFALECANAAKISDLVFLEYSLAPELKYPGQLVQAVEALRHLLTIYRASQIVIGGDSAGGNLALAVLAHIKTPSPYVSRLPAFESGRERFRAVFLLSPWARMSYRAKTYTSNADRDHVSAQGIKDLMALWEPAPNERWADPCSADARFWSEVPADKLLITAGGWEVFLDDIMDISEKLGARPYGSSTDVELVVAATEVHVESAIDTAMKVVPRGTEKGTLEWFRRALPAK